MYVQEINGTPIASKSLPAMFSPKQQAIGQKETASHCSRSLGWIVRNCFHFKGCEALKQTAQEAVESQFPEVFKDTDTVLKDMH